MSMIENFEKMLANGQDNALLRYTLGMEYSKQEDYIKAAMHLSKALEFDPNYSVAWKSLGKVLTAQDKIAEAIEVYEKGIIVAENKGDKQAAKEMQVFLKRLKK